MKRLLAIAGLVLVGSTLSACGAPRLLMRDAPSAVITAPAEGQARVVFAVPGSFRDVITIVDERGAYLGQLGARTFFTIETAPGPRRYYALVGSSAFVVSGTLEADRTYWVLGERALTRGTQWVSWPRECGGDEPLAGVRRLEVDPAADRAALDRQLGDVPQRMLEADRELEAMVEAERARRALVAAPVCE